MKDPLLLLSQLHGEGRVTRRALQAAGFLTLAHVATATAAELSDRAHLSARTADRLQAGARQLIEQGVEPDRASPAIGHGHRRPTRSRPKGLAPASPGGATRSPGVLPEEAALLRGEEPGAAKADAPSSSVPSKAAPRA